MNKKRLFNLPDLKVIEELDTMLAFFEQELAAFTAFDPTMDATFLANWKAAQDATMYVRRDDSQVIKGELLLADAVSALEKCRAKYRDVKYYAGKAFPANADILKEFGQGQFTKWRNSPLRMVQFMETLHGVATKYKTDLIASGYTQTAIDQIVTLTQELRNDNNLQQLKKKERPTTTRQRIEIMNTSYAFAQQVAAAAPHIFSQNAAKLNWFLLPSRPVKSNLKTQLIVAANSTRKITLPALLKKFSVTITHAGPEDISYWRANKISDVPAQKFTLTAGDIITVEEETPAKKFLLLQNTGSKVVRLMVEKK